MRIKGQVGALRWGYRPAATLGPWEFESNGQGGTFTAQVASCDEFAMSQSPLVVVVSAGNSQWRWPVRDITVSESTLHAVLGPRE
jgi:hypothetical protein